LNWPGAAGGVRLGTIVLAQTEMQMLTAVTVQPGRSVEAVAGNESGVNALVVGARNGDVEAFRELLEHFEERVFRFVVRMLRNAHDAEDVTQDTFVKAWRHLARFRPEHSFSTWLFTIARHTALNHLRARRHTEELGDHHEEAGSNGPDHAAEEREHAESVWSVARRLKPDQYEVLWLRYGEGFSVDETARIMNTNSIRVRVLLHRARKRMAGWLQHRNSKTGGVR
jgi:RNA polymerase sigma-70 factor (ECF subfamily)